MDRSISCIICRFLPVFSTFFSCSSSEVPFFGCKPQAKSAMGGDGGQARHFPWMVLRRENWLEKGTFMVELWGNDGKCGIMLDIKM